MQSETKLSNYLKILKDIYQIRVKKKRMNNVMLLTFH